MNLDTERIDDAVLALLLLEPARWPAGLEVILDPAVGRDRGAGESGCWQGAPTQWAPAHKEKQRGQRPEAPDQRACSGGHRRGERRETPKALVHEDSR